MYSDKNAIKLGQNYHKVDLDFLIQTFRKANRTLKSPTYFQLKKGNPSAFNSLRRHLSFGGWIKQSGFFLLSELQRFDLLTRLPLLGGPLTLARGLIFGHITEASISQSCEMNSSTEVIARDEAQKIVCVDILIIGSGPGAAIAAQHESRSENLLVLERGFPPRTSHKDHHNLVHVMNDFNLAGQELILSANLPQFAQARVTGGGSEVNSGLYHKLPEKIKDEFISKLNVSRTQWEVSEQFIENLLKPELMNVHPSKSVIAQGALAMGLESVNVPRWRTYDSDGNFSHRGMIEIFWSKFINNSTRRLQSGVDVKKIDTSNKSYVSVTGFDCLTSSFVEYRANRIHVSAGAISTPFLLAKSALISWSSTQFQWHPMIRVISKTPEHMLGWNDIDPFQAWTQDRNLKFGSAVSTPSLLAITLQRMISEDESKSLRSYYVSYSSSGIGGLVPHSSVPWYKYSDKDRENSNLGLAKLMDLVRFGGGEILNSVKLNPMKHSTVHIFGSLPANSTNFISGTNRLKSDERVLVSDGSLLPIGPGVNPQGVIMATVDAILKASL